MVEIATITLPAGSYCIRYYARFGNNSTGVRMIFASDGSYTPTLSNTPLAIQPAVNGDRTIINEITFEEAESETTYHLYAYQTSGGEIAIAPKILAIRIK